MCLFVCFPENPGCHYYVWVILAFLGLALIVSLIFNISHYVEKQRQGKTFWEIATHLLLHEWRLSHWKIYRRRQFYEMRCNRIFLSVENLFDTFFSTLKFSFYFKNTIILEYEQTPNLRFISALRYRVRKNCPGKM